MLTRNHKALNWDMGDLIEWCWEVMEDIGNYNAYDEMLDVEVKVESGRGRLPCGIMRLLRVRKNGVVYNNFLDDGVYLKPGFDNGTLIIDYLGIPSDEEGLPKIEITIRQCCYFYALKKLLIDDYLYGKIPENRWERICQDYDNSVAKARTSFRDVTMDDTDRLQLAMYSYLRPIANYRNWMYRGTSSQ